MGKFTKGIIALIIIPVAARIGATYIVRKAIKDTIKKYGTNYVDITPKRREPNRYENSEIVDIEEEA